jgi:hypothetical protein
VTVDLNEILQYYSMLIARPQPKMVTIGSNTPRLDGAPMVLKVYRSPVQTVRFPSFVLRAVHPNGRTKTQ